MRTRPTPVFADLQRQINWRHQANHPLNQLMEKYKDTIRVDNAAEYDPVAPPYHSPNLPLEYEPHWSEGDE